MAVNINILNGGNITITTGGSAPAGHADTWVKYTGDTTWTPVNIQGSIEAVHAGEYDYSPTTQIPNVTDVVELEIGTDVTSIGYCAFINCHNLTNVTIPSSVTNIEGYSFSSCSGLTNMTFNSFTKDAVKNLTTGTYIFGNTFYNEETSAIEKTFTATCTDGSMSIKFTADYPATITFTDL